uniref:Uncharacterized protein n=1 Tax=Aegilops tauschii TaxID=37682 RepID=R7W3J6_AEGTA
MLAAGTLEVARRRIVARHGTYTDADGAAYVPMSIFWQVPQYVVVGAAEVFTFIGQMEFFYDQAPDAMRSVCSGLPPRCAVPRRGGRPGWIPDDINDGHLDYFFWLLAMLCIGNFVGEANTSADAMEMEEAATGAGKPWVAERRKGVGARPSPRLLSPSCGSPLRSLSLSLSLSLAMQAAASASECRSLAAGALAPVQCKDVEAEGYAVEGISVSGHETCITVPSLNVAFDIGRGPLFAVR